MQRSDWHQGTDGPIFRASETDVRVQERIKNLVAYLASQQLPS